MGSFLTCVVGGADGREEGRGRTRALFVMCFFSLVRVSPDQFCRLAYRSLGPINGKLNFSCLFFCYLCINVKMMEFFCEKEMFQFSVDSLNAIRGNFFPRVCKPVVASFKAFSQFFTVNRFW